MDYNIINMLGIAAIAIISALWQRKSTKLINGLVISYIDINDRIETLEKKQKEGKDE